MRIEAEPGSTNLSIPWQISKRIILCHIYPYALRSTYPRHGEILYAIRTWYRTPPRPSLYSSAMFPFALSKPSIALYFGGMTVPVSGQWGLPKHLPELRNKMRESWDVSLFQPSSLPCKHMPKHVMCEYLFFEFDRRDTLRLKIPKEQVSYT